MFVVRQHAKSHSSRKSVKPTKVSRPTNTLQLEILETREVLTHSVARLWDEALLDAIRRDVPNPPIHARNLFHLSAAMYDAWAVYDPVAQGYITTEKDTAPDIGAARDEAISYAAYRVLSERFSQPKSVGWAASTAEFDALMLELGYDKNVTTTIGTTPAAIGNRIGQAMLQYGYEDGANEINFYQDVTGYQTINPNLIVDLPGAGDIIDPNRWQKLTLDVAFTQNGIQTSGNQPAIGTNARWVKPFAMTRETPFDPYDDPGQQPLLGGVGDEILKAQVVEMIQKSGDLDPADTTTINISPDVYHNNPLGTQDGTGYGVNPVTGLPYGDNIVLEADYGRVLAEFWADGPQSETPPGHWNVLANYVSDQPSTVKQIGGVGPVVDDLEWDVKLYFSLNGAVHDAATAAWSVKYIYDSSRPITLVRYMAGLGQSSDPMGPSYHPDGLPLVPGLIEVITTASSAPGERHEQLADHVGEIAIYAWAGKPDDPQNEVGGSTWRLGTTWIPYQRDTFVTPAFPGYVSGHSTFSRSAAEVLTNFTGSPYFPGGLGTFVADTDYLHFEDGPSEAITLMWATYYDAADEAGVSRRWGGIHIAADDYAGRIMGSTIGNDAYALATEYFTGTVDLPSLRTGGEYTLIEGNSLHLRASVDTTLDPGTIEWDLNDDGIYGDVVGGDLIVSWATLNTFGIVDGPANHQINVRASDGIGGAPVIESTWLNVFNKKPTANAGGPYTLRVGDSLTLDASASSDVVDSVTYTWDVNGDGIYGDAVGVNPTLTPAQLIALNVYGNPKSFSVTVKVSDGQPNGTTISAPVALNLVEFQTYNLAVDSNQSSLTVAGSYIPPVGPTEPLSAQSGSSLTVALGGLLEVGISPNALFFEGGSAISLVPQGGVYEPGSADAGLAFESQTPSVLVGALRDALLDALSGFTTLDGDGTFAASSVDLDFALGSLLSYSLNGGPTEQFDLDGLAVVNNVAVTDGQLETVGNNWRLTVPIQLSLTIPTVDGGELQLTVSGQIVATVPLPAFNDVAPSILPLTSSPLSFPGGGAAGDFDGDGYVDLFLSRRETTNGLLSIANNPVISVLYRNRGDGTFEDVTVGSGIDIPMYANGANWADIDNDGDLDLYVSSWLAGNEASGRNYLFINDGTGHFTEEALDRNAGIDRDGQIFRFSEGVSFGDFNNDGYLDMIVAEMSFGDAPKAYGPYTRLLKNRGAAQPGYFDDVTDASGIDIPFGRVFNSQIGYSAQFADLDEDGWQDVIISADWGTSRLYWNNHDGTFTDGTTAAGVGLESYGMGSNIADYNGDGLLDFFVGSIYAAGHPVATGNRLYLNNGDRTFTEGSLTYGVRASQWSWGNEGLDFDNDGLMDLVVTNGFDDIAAVMNDPELGDVDPVAEFLTDRTMLFHNVGGTMQEVGLASGIVDDVNGRGLVKFDYDNDGDVDILVLNTQSRPVLYRNNLSNGNSFLKISLEGAISNRMGVGAKISVFKNAIDPPQVENLERNGNYRGASDSTVHFGLGSGSDPIYKIRIEWPSGLVQEIFDVARDSTLLISEADALPVVNVAGPTEFLVGYAEEFTLSVDRQTPIVGDYTFSIDWDNDGNVDEVVVGPSGTTVTHTFSTLGLTTVRVTAVGSDGITAAEDLYTASTVYVALRPDSGNPSIMNLIWVGSVGDDAVTFTNTDPTSVTVSTSLYDGQAVSALDLFTGVTGRIIATGDGGSDTLDAGEATLPAELTGGLGDDLIVGGSANDSLIGEDGLDTIWGGLGNDLIDGGDDADLIYGDHPTASGRSLSKLSLGNDTVNGSDGDDTLYGDGDGGEGVADTINGGDGHDVINADGSEGGANIAGDSIDGGEDNDTIYADGAEGSPDTILGSGGDDLIDTGGGNDSALGGSGNDILLGGDGAQGANDTLIGEEGADILVGDGGVSNFKSAVGGVDLLDGGSGQDLIVTGLVNLLFTPSFSWNAVRNEWVSAAPILERRDHILGTTSGGLNGSSELQLGINTFNDKAVGSSAAVADVVFGGSEADWILLDVSEEAVGDNEVIDQGTDLFNFGY